MVLSSFDKYIKTFFQTLNIHVNIGFSLLPNQFIVMIEYMKTWNIYNSIKTHLTSINWE